MSHLIRRWEPADTPQVYDLHIRTLRAVGALPDNQEWDRDLFTIQASYLDAGGEFLVIVDGAQVIGMGAYTRIDATTIEVKRMRIGVDRQGTGLGRAMLLRLLELARTRGFVSAIVSTTQQQVVAQRLYEQAGFQRTGTGEEMGFGVVYYRLPSLTSG